LLFSALGATATRRDDGIAGLGLSPPEVVPPEDTDRWGNAADRAGVGHQMISEFRVAPLVHPDPARPGHMAMWGRVLDATVTTSAKLGFLADMVPIAACRAAGIDGAGTSLDNTLRLGELVDTEWVLIELEGQAVHGSYGHGVTHLWSPDGRLMAIGSQSAKLFSFQDFAARRVG
jgi:acyl-CoA thioesterase